MVVVPVWLKVPTVAMESLPTVNSALPPPEFTDSVLLIVVAPFKAVVPVTAKLPPIYALLVTERAPVVVVPELLMVVLLTVLVLTVPADTVPVVAMVPLPVSKLPAVIAPLALRVVTPEIAPAALMPPLLLLIPPVIETSWEAEILINPVSSTWI